MIYIISRCWCNIFTLTAANVSKWSWKPHLEFLVYISKSDRKQRSMNSSLVKTWKQFWNSLFSLTPHVFFPFTCPCHHFHENHTSKRGNLLSCLWVLLFPSDFSWKMQIQWYSVTILLWPYNGWLRMASLSIHKLEFEVNFPHPIGCLIEIWMTELDLKFIEIIVKQQKINKFAKFIYLIFRFFLFIFLFFLGNTLFR